MKLLQIKLTNFRQFYGSQEISFSTDDKKNVTVVHAENGIGKTTLLNAVLWAMYGETTTKFEQKEKVLNFTAKNEGKRVASVEVYFEHSDENYFVQRVHDESQPRNQQTFRAFEVNAGNFETLPSPVAFINQVIPRDIAKYFFFDGEHAETFAAEKNNKQVNAAIRNILGCGLVETGIEDLKELRKRLNREIGNIPGSAEVETLEKERNSAAIRVEQAQTFVSELEQNLQTRLSQIEKIEDRLRAAKPTKELQKVRDGHKRELARAKENLNRHEAKIASWVGESGYFVAGKKLADVSLEFIEDTTARGVIPEPYNEEFVKGLLEAELCICDRNLKPRTDEFAAVMKLLETASTADIRRKIMRAQSRITSLRDGAKAAPGKLKEAYGLKQDEVARVDRYEQNLTEVSQKIQGLPEDESKELEVSRNTLRDEVAEINRKIGAQKVTLEDNTRTMKRAERERDSILSKGRLAEGLIERRDLVESVAAHLESELKSYEDSARGVILKKVNDVLESTSRKNFIAHLESDFSLYLKMSTTTGQAPKSGGENQLLSLAFIAALTNFSKVRQHAGGGKWVAGTVAPLVLDSPFGQLDPEYRKSTATFIPEMAEQVIMLVSRSQGDDTVLNAIDDRIGAEYVLVAHSTGEKGTKPDDKIDLHGKEYIRSLYSQERDQTVIVSVPRPGEAS